MTIQTAPRGCIRTTIRRLILINIEQLVAALQQLSDAEFQDRAWLASEGPAVSSFSEQVCQTFDDTGLADALDSATDSSELDERAILVLRELDAAISRLDHNAAPESLLTVPKMNEVRILAAQALSLLK